MASACMWVVAMPRLALFHVTPPSTLLKMPTSLAAAYSVLRAVGSTTTV